MEKSIRKALFVFTVIGFGLGMRFLIEFVYTFLLDRYAVSSIIGFSLRSGALIVFLLLWLLITLRSENYQNKLPWLMLLLLDPISGMVLFMTFGRNFKNSSRYRKRPFMVESAFAPRSPDPDPAVFHESTVPHELKNILNSIHKQNHLAPFVNTTHTEVFQNGERFYPALIQDIQSAQSFILFQFYIVKDDERGGLILEALRERAQAGVEVKMIIDGLGSVRLNRRSRQRLKAAGIELVVQDRVYFPLFNTRINFRNHRKIVVIDGHKGYLGGMNIANEYDNSIPHDFYFRDTQLKLVGQAVQSLTTIFFKDYYYNTGRFIDEDRYYPKTDVKSSGVVHVIESGPDSEFAHIRDAYIRLILTAQSSIKIMTPYMALDQETLTALKVAAKSGVDVEIIIPGIPDKRLVYRVTTFFMGLLLEAGVKVYTYDPGFCHSKVLIVDDRIASVGSYNLDNRSAVIDFEVTALLYNDSVQELVYQFAIDKDASTLKNYQAFKKRSYVTRLFEGALSIFTPIL